MEDLLPLLLLKLLASTLSAANADPLESTEAMS